MPIKTKPKTKPKKIFAFSFYHLIPNILTLVALCFGLTAIRYGIGRDWEQATLFIAIAGFFDFMDGRVARYLNATSPFGANLDSLADFISFGIAPALILYAWTLSDLLVKGVGWGAVLLFAICGATRLARFNVGSAAPDNKKTDFHKLFFVGVPIPMGATLALTPLMISFEFPEAPCIQDPWFNFVCMTLVAFAMASRIPTFAVKHVKITREKVKLFLALVGALIVALIVKTWITLIIFSSLYVLSIPVSCLAFYRASTSRHGERSMAIQSSSKRR